MEPEEYYYGGANGGCNNNQHNTNPDIVYIKSVFNDDAFNDVDCGAAGR